MADRWKCPQCGRTDERGADARPPSTCPHCGATILADPGRGPTASRSSRAAADADADESRRRTRTAKKPARARSPRKRR